MKYPVLVDDINDDDELPIVLAVVNQRHSSYLHVPFERLVSFHEKKSNYYYKFIIKKHFR